jgi:hypothetical protein
MRLYRVTTAELAAAALREGFRDAEGTYFTGEVHRGVWLTDDPVGVSGSGAVWTGGAAETILEVTLDVADDAGELAAFEWITFPGPAVVGVNYREWLIPAAWLAKHVVAVRVVEDDDELRATLERERKPIPPLP